MQKADRPIFPAPFIDVLASLFLDESAEIFYSEEEALMDAILVIIRGFGKTDGSSFIGHCLSRVFRPLSKIASPHLFDASRSDRPDESGHLQYY